MPSTVRTSLTALALAVALLAPVRYAAAACGEKEPGRVEWTFEEDGRPLYRAVFTGRAATFACFELLNPQYARAEQAQMPAGVPEWMGAPGPLNLVTTWDTEYLPYSLSFLSLADGHDVTRTVKAPTSTAQGNGWKAGESRTASALDFYKADPTYALVSSSEVEAVYVWPDPATDKSDFFIEKRYTRLAGFSVGLSVTVFNFSATDVSTQPQVEVHVWEASRPKGGMFSPPPNVAEGLCLTGDSDLERHSGTDLVGKTINPSGESRWAAVGNRYFLHAVVARGLTEARCTLAAGANGVVSALLYRANPFLVAASEGARCYPDWFTPSQELLRCTQVAARLGISYGQLFTPTETEKAFTLKKDSLAAAEADETLSVLKNLGSSKGAVLYQYEFYVGPKDIDRLKEPGVGLEDSLDFWVLGFISKPMLYLLRWFYSLVPHWAVAILLLTVLVKLALLYWTQKSYAQMQRMASLKPMMEEIKQKYGRDKERLNQEMMNLYKREKVNPLGGCLPMLLQMPIWIALYRTIYSAVDLYQAPLGLWITDLSAPDPYFVLPLVLGASMFLQQKLSPTTMDSAQAKMMLYIMPVMFTVFMLFLPSGLNLYILVNTVLSLAQQWYLRKKLSPSPVAKAA